MLDDGHDPAAYQASDFEPVISSGVIAVRKVVVDVTDLKGSHLAIFLLQVSVSPYIMYNCVRSDFSYNLRDVLIVRQDGVLFPYGQLVEYVHILSAGVWEVGFLMPSVLDVIERNIESLRAIRAQMVALKHAKPLVTQLAKVHAIKVDIHTLANIALIIQAALEICDEGNPLLADVHLKQLVGEAARDREDARALVRACELSHASVRERGLCHGSCIDLDH